MFLPLLLSPLSLLMCLCMCVLRSRWLPQAAEGFSAVYQEACSGLARGVWSGSGRTVRLGSLKTRLLLLPIELAWLMHALGEQHKAAAIIHT